MPSNRDKSALLDQIQFDAVTRRLFELIPGVCFFIKDRAGCLLYCNEAHRRGIFRYGNADDIYGKQNHDFFPNALATAFAQDDQHVMQAGEPLFERCELNITSSGSLSWFCTTKIPARDFHGRVVGLIGISRPIDRGDERITEYELLSPALEHIRKHCTEKIKISALASACHMTEVTFRRKFQRLFRMTPLRFILRLRLHEACLLVSAGTTSIGDIASQCGFEDQNYFARHFKRTMGVTPSVFREQHKLQVATNA